MPTSKTQLFVRDADGGIDAVVPVTDLDPLPVSLTSTRDIERTIGEGVANTAFTLSTPLGAKRRLIQSLVHYSAAPTQAGATTILNSGGGANYDTTLNTGSANAQSTVYLPAADLYALETDAVDVTAPAGGAGIIAYISIYTEIIE